MNLVGKIFIVLIFVMSILFMGFVVAVYATHTNWRDRVINPDTGLEAQLKNVQLEVERLTNQMTKTEQELATEKAARQNQLGKLETQKERWPGNATNSPRITRPRTSRPARPSRLWTQPTRVSPPSERRSTSCVRTSLPPCDVRDDAISTSRRQDRRSQWPGD